MKKPLQLAFCICLVFLSDKIIAQVTKLANNKNLEFALPLGTNAALTTTDDSLWVTDGTPSGTRKLSNIVSLADNQAVVFNNRIFFAGTNAANGTELWSSNCTTPGTKLFKDINPGTGSSSPTNFFVYNNLLFFFAKTNGRGNELWRSDGTVDGTVIVRDIYPGKGSSVDD